MPKVFRLLAFCGLVLAITTAVATASPLQEASFQDNRLLLGAPTQVTQTLATLRALGVDRLRVSVVWGDLAPDASSPRMPLGFDGADPAAYPAGSWAPFDRLATEAPKYGLKLNFDLMGQAPRWATPTAPAANLQGVWYPSASKFGAFVAAVGKRYSGTYDPPGESAPLPRVSFWSIWNEPNVGTSSLSPQTVGGVDVGPQLYRGLANAAFDSLIATGHRPGSDTILVGEMASTGHLDPGARLGMQPLRFLRALYCVDAGYRPLRGAAAAAQGCPSSPAASRRFRADNPALFEATGWSHHPYDLSMAPTAPIPAVGPDWVTFANLTALEEALDRIQRVYGSSKQFPLYLTEYGYETNPPQTVFSISPALQGTYLNEGEYIAWRDPRVQMLSQYLLVDAGPAANLPGSSFATGLEFSDGAHKASFAAYRMPLWLPTTSARRGQAVEVWGAVRPAKRYRRARVAPVDIQLDGRTVRAVALTNPQGYFDVQVSFAHSGSVQLAWRYPGGATIYSRPVSITETAAATVTSGTTRSSLYAALGVVVLGGGTLLAWRFRRGRRTAGRR